MRPGALFFSPPGLRHAIHPGELHRPVSYYAVLFSLDQDEPLRAVVDAPTFVRSFPRDDGTRHRVLFEDLHTRYAHPHPARRRAGEHMLQTLLWDLAAELETFDPKPTSVSGAAVQRATTAVGADEDDADEDDAEPPSRANDGVAVTNPSKGVGGAEYNVHIERALHLFDRHVARAITIQEVARRVGVTQEHLTRLFDRAFGVSPLQYYRRLRMEIAASKLLNTTLSVKEIAWELGYANPFHLSRSFRRYAGISPSEYRRQYYQTNPMGYAGRVVDGTPE